MVKKTVNQDDISAYHLFYADALARPGTDLTFFDWPAPPRAARHALRSRAPGCASPGAEACTWWKERLERRRL